MCDAGPQGSRNGSDATKFAHWPFWTLSCVPAKDLLGSYVRDNLNAGGVPKRMAGPRTFDLRRARPTILASSVAKTSPTRGKIHATCHCLTKQLARTPTVQLLLRSHPCIRPHVEATHRLTGNWKA